MTAWVRDDGGRSAAGFRGSTGDCVTRAIAIVTGVPYRDVYDDLFARSRHYAATSRRVKRLAANGVRYDPSPRTGMPKEVYEPFLFERGWVWHPTMTIGSGCRVHLRADELPAGTIIARVTRHLCAVIDGVIHDTHDPSRGGSRCVYGYYARG